MTLASVLSCLLIYSSLRATVTARSKVYMEDSIQFPGINAVMLSCGNIPHPNFSDTG